MTDNKKNITTRDPGNLSRLCGEQLSIKFGNDEDQFFCICRGVHPDRYFMTQAPVANGIENKLIPGTQAVVRFVDSGMVCGFKTNIQQFITRPYRLIFFDYPDSIEMMNLRTSKRVAVSLKGAIQWEGQTFDGSIRDLSCGGCFFVLKFRQDSLFNNLDVGSELTISFSTLDEKPSIELKCKVVRVIKDGDDLKMGLSFDGEHQESLDRVATFVDYISQLLED